MHEHAPDCREDTLARRGPHRRSPARLKPRVAALVLCLSATAVALAASSTGFAASPSTHAGATTQGWGPEASYVGRYRLRGASEQRSGSAATRVTRGSLTLFLRVLHPGAPLLPSGILTLEAPAPLGTELLYLTALTSDRSAHHAVVNGGAYVGPVLGSVSVTFGRAGLIRLSGKVSGIGKISATFTRFSSSPQP